jgi:hypothetical protein
MSPCHVADWQLFVVVCRTAVLSSLVHSKFYAVSRALSAGGRSLGVMLPDGFPRLHFASVRKFGFQIANSGTQRLRFMVVKWLSLSAGGYRKKTIKNSSEADIL